MKRIPRSEGENGVNFGGVGIEPGGNFVTVQVARAIEDDGPLPMVEIGCKGLARVALFGSADDLRYLAQCCMRAADYAEGKVESDRG